MPVEARTLRPRRCSLAPTRADLSAPKRLTAARLAGVPELEETFSDTTDTKDIWDGGGEQPPSAGRHVELLQESLLAMGYELPRFGIDGIYGSETTAAATQFQIDAGHPLPAGHEWEHVLGIAGPNTLAHFDIFDPGGTVGYVTPAETGVPANAARFSESPDHLFAGFDDSTSPPWLVVGTRTRRRVRVELDPADADVTFSLDDPSIASLGRTHEGIVVGGERAGTTSVRATAGGVPLAELLVSVKDPREEVVNFLFVSDSSTPRFATERDHEKATLLTLRLNRVWRRQANVHFTLGQVAEVVMAEAIGPEVGATSLESLVPHAVAGGLNVFLVWSIERGLDPLRTAEKGGVSMLLLPDDDCHDGMDVPHGAGHYLGVPLECHGSGVMSTCEGESDRRRVPKEVADVVNPS